MSLLLRALKGQPVERPPVWFMRQAGRYLPEYHEVRAKVDFLQLCRTPELAAEVTLQPLRRFPFDASIVFNDILVPPAAMGMELVFESGHGPRFPRPIRGRADVERLRRPEVERDMPEVLETIRILKGQLQVPLFGFAGAPFTLAAYMIEGGASRHFLHLRRAMLAEPETVHALLDLLTGVVGDYLVAQVEAGCDAVQLFDTWAGLLPPDDFQAFALPYARRALERVRGVPRVYFTRDAGPFLHLLPAVGADALALDWRVDLARARAQLGELPVMGNLDPTVLYGPEPVIRQRVRDVIRAAGPRGHVFNLGHGLLPTTPIEGVAAAVDEVHRWRWSAQA